MSLTKEEIERAFKEVDTNGDGTIDSTELQALYKKMGMVISPDRSKAILASIDKNDDAKLNVEEFALLVSKLISM